MGVAVKASAAAPVECERVRVLHVHSGNMFGGVEWFLRTLARHGHHAPWMTTEVALCFDDRIASDLRRIGTAVHLLGPVRVRARRSVTQVRRRLLEVLGSGAYDVVVTHSPWAHAIFGPVVRRYDARLAMFMHDLPNRRGWIDHLANRTVPDVVLCNTRFMQNAGPWWFAGVTRRMVRYPVPLPELHDQDARRRLRASLETPQDAVVILQASRMQAWKGHQLLVESLGELRANPRWVCWIAGGAQRPEEEAFEREVRAEVDRLGLRERVKFLGYRNDVPAVMKAADIYCQANTEPEPFGVAFLEALAAGLPIVTTAMGGPLEIVDDQCGVLVPCNPRAIARELGALVDDDARRAAMSAAAPGRAREMCDVPTRVRELGATLSALRADAPSSGVGALLDASRSAVAPARDALLEKVAALVRAKGEGVRVVEIGCGPGHLARHLDGRFRAYVGADIVRAPEFPNAPGVSFLEVDLDALPYPFDAGSANVAVATHIERVENPRALLRELARIARPGGVVIVACSNRLSLASKLHLLARNRFPSVPPARGRSVPRRRSAGPVGALIESDLRRIAGECGLLDVEVHYADRGAPGWEAPDWAAAQAGRGAWGRWFRDSLVLVARRP